MKRAILIGAVVVVVVGLVGGIMVYKKLTATGKLLTRAQTEIEAKHYDRAYELARNYSAQVPEDVLGYQFQARALIHQGRYDDARAVLEGASDQTRVPAITKIVKEDVTCSMLLADTYSDPAGKRLTAPETESSTAALQEVVAQFERALEVLKSIESPDAKRMLDIRVRQGIIEGGIGEACNKLTVRYGTEEDRAKMAGNDELRRTNSEAKKAAEKRKTEYFTRAIDTLLEVVQQDNTREDTARRLADLCSRHGSRESLNKVRAAFGAMASPPAEAAMMMAHHEYINPEPGMSFVDLVEHRKKLVSRMDGILKANSDNIPVRLLRAEIALMQQDVALSEKLCDEVLKAEPESSRARMLRGRLLLVRASEAQQDSERLDLFQQAEQTLSSLRSRLGWAAETHYFYYQAAMGLANSEYLVATRNLNPKENIADRVVMEKAAARRSATQEMARTALRRAADLGHFTARRDFAVWLLSQQSNDEALADARACYEQAPDLPEAVELMVVAAVATKQAGLARSVLATAEKSANKNPEMHLARASGWQTLQAAYPLDKEIKDLTDKAVDEAGKLSPTTTAGRWVLGRILKTAGRYPEAEVILRKAIDFEPKMPRLRVELGEVYEADGRSRQALEEYRAAVRLEPTRALWRSVLAHALARRGDYQESLDECKEALRLEPNNTDVLYQYVVLCARLNLPIPQEDLATLQRTQHGTKLALTLHQSGQNRQSIKLCEEVLRRDPNNLEALGVLAAAYRADNQLEACAKTLAKLIALEPDNDGPYLDLASLLARQGGPDQVRTKMLAVAGAKPHRVDSAIGRMLLHDRRFDAAAEAFRRAADDPKAKSQVRNEAVFRRASALFNAGQTAQALAEVEPLLKDPLWGHDATLSKVAMLARSNKREEALSLLAALRTQARDAKDGGLMIRIIQTYSVMNAVDEALASCDLLARMLPEQADGMHLLRGEVLALANRLEDSVPHFRKALEAQPKAFTIRRRLALILDRLNKPMEALQQLEILLDEKAGHTANLLGRIELAALYRSWGLDEKALLELQTLAAQGYGRDPAVLLAVGQALAMFGDKEQAIKQLQAVPVATPQYIEAQQTILVLSPDPAARRELLKSLAAKRPGDEGVLRYTLKTLSDMGDYAEAERAYREYAEANYVKTVPPQDVADQAVAVMVELGRTAEAAELSKRMYQDTKQPGWRFMTLCLTADTQPAAAKALLPPVGEATYIDAVYGYLLHRKGGEAAAWLSRLQATQEQPLPMVPARPVPALSKLLVALVAGENPAAAQAALAKEGFAVRSTGEELVAYAKAQPAKSAEEAAELLKITTAELMAANSLAYAQAMGLLQKRPQCLAAAQLACVARPTSGAYGKVTDMIRPADGVLARGLRGVLLSMEDKHDQAIKILQGLVDEGHAEPAVLDWLARSLEAVDRKAEAAKYYRDLWAQDRGAIMAANNGAYLLATADPANKQNLAEARSWIEEAAKVRPDAAFVLDTTGWIAYLQGRHEDALRDLLTAIKVMRGFPQVHSHLGQAALATGHKDLARLHLEAAVRLLKQREASKEDVTSDMTDAVRQARQALDKNWPGWEKRGA